MKAVFDTNIFISAFVIPGSQGERAFLLAQQKRFELYTSVAILTETASKLREKFNQSEEDVKHALTIIARAAEVLKPTLKLSVLKDEPDNRILECAIESSADIVVTGDRHLLKLRKFRSFSIIRLADLLRMFPELAEK